MADVILLKGVSHTAMPLLAPREPAVAFDPMTGDAKLWIGTTVGNELVSGLPGPAGGSGGLGLFASDYGVKADGLTDDTAAMQQAIDAVIMGGAGNAGPKNTLILPKGTINIKDTLHFARTGGGQFSGIRVLGMGASVGLGSEAGTTIALNATGKPAVIDVGTGFFNNSIFQGFQVQGCSDNTTTYGIHWSQTNWSAWTLRDVYVSLVNTALREDYGTGNANGENLLLDQFRWNLIVSSTVVFDFQAGEAYSITVLGGGGSQANGGTFLRIGQGGYKFQSLGCSINQGFGPLANTFLDISSTGGNITVRDTRLDGQTDTVVKLGGGSSNLNDIITVEDSHFQGVVCKTGLVTGGGTNAQQSVNFVRDRFDAASVGNILPAQIARPSATIALDGGGFPRLRFDGCRFVSGFASVNLGAKPAAATTYAGTVINDCWMDTPASTLLVPLTN